MLSFQLKTILLTLLLVTGASTAHANGSPWLPAEEVAFETNGVEMSPADEQLRALYAELQNLLWIDDRGGWPEVPADATLELGMMSEAVETLRIRLVLVGDLPNRHNQAFGSMEAQTFDFELLQAVMRFQNRHGLEADGAVGHQTLRALNVPVAQRIEQVQRNIRRWEDLEPKLGEDFLIVNIPEFQLRLYDNQQTKLDMRVVVGKTKSPTPELTEELEYFVMNPYWFVPKRIGVREVLPKAQANPDYLQNASYEVWSGNQRVDTSQVAWDQLDASNFEYSFRQKPGASNSLGKVKFAMPNPRAIFLHDTPSQSHFEKTRRAYSHGCIRLEEPMRLASALMEMQNGYSEDDINARLTVDYTKRIELEEHLPVHVVYLTNWARAGVVHYFDDIYGRDRQESQQREAEVQTYTASVEPAEQDARTSLTWSTLATAQ